MTDHQGSKATLPARRPGPRVRRPLDLDATTSRMIRQLSWLYAVERRLVAGLADVFREATAISDRLTISDLRKETRLQLGRLEHMLQVAQDGRHPETSSPESDFAGDAEPTHPIQPSVVAALRSAEAAANGYATTFALATRAGHAAIAERLAESLREKRAAAATLSALAEHRP